MAIQAPLLQQVPNMLSSLSSPAIGSIKSANAHDVNSMVGATSFGDFLKESSRKALTTLRQNEKATMQSASGTNDLIHTMTAADNAEITLQTIMAVRDRTVQAYQEISRMPI